MITVLVFIGGLVLGMVSGMVFTIVLSDTMTMEDKDHE